jgi:hypothetical protein
MMNKDRKCCKPSYKQPQPGPAVNSNGYPEKDVKTSGVKIRGTGAATKGTMARGPMA